MSTTKILVRGVNWLGDAVMTTPALMRLKEAHRDAHITLLTDAKLADLWQNHPALDAVLTFTTGESVRSIGGRLRGKGFELGLILPNSPRSALELWWAGIPRRLGYKRSWRSWFLTDPIPARSGAAAMQKRSVTEIRRLVTLPNAVSSSSFPASAHQIFDYLHLVSQLGATATPTPPFLAVTEEELHAVRCRWRLAPSPARPLFGLNPGAEYGPAKRWPKERFAAAALEIHKQTNCRWLLLGGKAEVALAHEIAEHVKSSLSRQNFKEDHDDDPAVVNLAGATTLRELCAVLKTCGLLLTNDTGPMHIAAAVGTPVIVPFGSTSPELTGPGLPGRTRSYLLRSNAPCSPCFLRECPIDFRCMSGIGVQQVVEAALEITRHGVSRE